MELFSTKAGSFDERALHDGIEAGGCDASKTGGGGKGIKLVRRDGGHRPNDWDSSPTEGTFSTITPSSSLSSISSLSTASTLSNCVDPTTANLPANIMDANDNAHSTQNASLNCSTSMSSSHPSILLAEPVILEPFSHQVGGHSSVLRFDGTTLCKPVIPRERKFYESKLPNELKRFIPEFRGILEVKIVDEQEGYLALEGHKIYGSPPVLDYHRSQSLNNSRSSSQSHASSPANSRSRSAAATAPSTANSENLAKPARFRFRRTGSIEPPVKSEEKSNKLNSPSAKDINQSPNAKDARQDVDKSVNRDSASGSSMRESRSSSVVINPWNIKMVKKELENMRKKDTNHKCKFLLQENAVHNFRCPTIIDLKMGVRQYGDDATEEKKRRFIEKTNMSTSLKLGVRLCGLQVYHVPTRKYIYVSKYKGRHCSVGDFKRILFMFLFNGRDFRLDVVDAVLVKLRDLYDVVAALKSYRFFSSSLLVGYDAQPSQVNLYREPSRTAGSSNVQQSNSSAATSPRATSNLDTKELSKPQQRPALATSSIVNKNGLESSSSSSAQTIAPHELQCNNSHTANGDQKSTPTPPLPAPAASTSSSATPGCDCTGKTTTTTSAPGWTKVETKSSAPLVDLKMIDFAHTTTSSFADEIVYEGPDDGYLFGLDNMIRIFEEIKKTPVSELRSISSRLHTDYLIPNKTN